MNVEEAHRVVVDALTLDPGRFYSAGADLHLGVGKLYARVRFPVFDITEAVYDTGEGSVLVLTHECDVDAANDRPFTDYLLVCPIIRFESFVEEYSARLGDERLRGFLVDLAKHNVSRVSYVPWGPESLPFGGLLYLNQISSTHVTAFAREEVTAIGATTAYGLIIIDKALTNHLLRPKVERLALED
jgi:hypothetical protein